MTLKDSSLATRARARVVPIPDQLDLLADLHDVYERALNAQRVWITKGGEDRSYPAPDFRAAISAIRVKAEICGFIREKPSWDTDQLVADAMRRALADPELRKMLVAQLREIEPALLADGKARK